MLNKINQNVWYMQNFSLDVWAHVTSKLEKNDVSEN